MSVLEGPREEWRCLRIGQNTERQSGGDADQFRHLGVSDACAPLAYSVGQYGRAFEKGRIFEEAQQRILNMEASGQMLMISTDTALNTMRKVMREIAAETKLQA